MIPYAIDLSKSATRRLDVLSKIGSFPRFNTATVDVAKIKVEDTSDFALKLFSTVDLLRKSRKAGEIVLSFERPWMPDLCNTRFTRRFTTS